jgi:CRISPR-associated protein Csm2
MANNAPAHGRGSQSRPPQNPPRHQTQPSTLDTSKIVFGPNINAKLYSDIAEAAAKDVGKGSRDQNKPSQLRRFYDELVMLQSKVGSNKQHFQQNQPFIQMLKAKVAYAEGRKKVDNKFASLLRHVVDQAEDHQTLKQARLFMEAFMAFYKIHGPND